MKYHKTQSGFSLIETLVAITILLVVIVGPMSITSSSARSTSFASDQVIAFFLAQEGVELVQKARDDLLFRQFLPVGNSQRLNSAWDEFKRTTGNVPLRHCYVSIDGGNGCGLEINNSGQLNSGIACGGTGASCRLYYNDATNNVRRSRYTHITADAEITPFTRVIRIQPVIGSDYEVKVTSTVTWRSGLTSTVQSVSVENHLFNTYAN